MIWGNELFKFSYYIDHPYKAKESVHQHDGLEFLLVHEGAGRVVINHRIYSVAPRTLVFFKPRQPHQILLAKPFRRSGAKLRNFFTDPLMQYFPSLIEFIGTLDSNPSIAQMYALDERDYQELDSLYRRLHESFSAAPRHAHQELFLLFLLQMIAYFKFHVFPEAQPFPNLDDRSDSTPPPAHIAAAIEWMHRHYAEPFDLNRLAEAVHFSPSHISRLFRQYTGMTLTDYLTGTRLKEARSLLETSALSIRQVGLRVGFPDPAYFCRSFKRSFGVSPLQYRNVASCPQPLALDAQRFT
jgi:AraC-like DNA-binding protein